MEVFQTDTTIQGVSKPLWETGSVIRCLTAPGKDIFAKTLKYKEMCDSAKAYNIFPYKITCMHRKNGMLLARTETGEEKWVIDAASNDYLSLSHHPAVIAAVNEAIGEYGVGAQGAAMLNGNTPLHRELEEELAAFLGKEALSLSSSGYGTMIAVISAMARSTDVVFHDHYCHPCLEDGMTISGAKTYKYPHNDMEALARLLEQYRHNHRGALIVSDGVCSTNGSIAPVAELVCLAKRYEARLFIDDAHGIGTLHAGRGCTAGKQVDLIGGVLSKALASAGGFVAGDRDVIEYIRFFGRSNCSTTNISVANAAASLAALRIMRREPERVEALQAKVRRLRQGLYDLGYPTSDSTSSIISLICGSDADAYRAWRKMFDAGVLVHALPFPIVPLGESRIRIRLNYSLSAEHIEQIIAAVPSAVPGGGRAKKHAEQKNIRLDELGFVARTVETPKGPVVLHLREGSGPVRLFLHPLLFGGETYGDVLRRYKSTFAVAALEWWGHGHAAPTAQEVTLDDMAECLSLVISTALPGKEVRLVGTSMGAMAALNCAISKKVPIRSLLLIGGSADPEEGHNRRVFESLLEVAGTLGVNSVTEDIMTVMFSSHFRYERPVTAHAFSKSLLDRPAINVAPCVRAVLNRPDIAMQLGGVSCPTTVMVGDEDIAEPVGHSERLAESIPNARLRIVPNCGHLVPIEAPTSVLEILHEWDIEDMK